MMIFGRESFVLFLQHSIYQSYYGSRHIRFQLIAVSTPAGLARN
jgi:hypothetical protein